MRYIMGYTQTKEECCLTGDDDPTLWRAKMPCSHVFCKKIFKYVLIKLQDSAQFIIMRITIDFHA